MDCIDTLGHVTAATPALKAMQRALGRAWQYGIEISWQVYFLAMIQRMTKVPLSCDL
jgi:hypothetical protein